MLQILELPPLQGNHHLLQLLKLYRASSVVRTLTETDRCVLPAICPVKFVENGHFARACRSKGSSNDFASAAYHCACPVCAPTLPCFCSNEFRIRRRTWDVE